ncbi:hypothetical protein BDZ90DRAFT_228435 [Jaminaea rosea]|uniref:Uncharacterized protein n=1 Tax=Jaminaea rosea TaxID=1569628 RepID=A0A316UJE3_9BASI|nr:hypothetical protein BDZ90DRAFT_228435 [Jaminaea rosea]PWN25402.1 hypothetical protein BDZ90DRAFT_228435 [Jaminaea rosea]
MLQEALNLYLLEMAQIERIKRYEVPDWRSEAVQDECPSECREGICGHYPRVFPAKTGSKKAKEGPDEQPTMQSALDSINTGIFRLHMAQLDRPLRRKGLCKLGINDDNAIFVDYGANCFDKLYGDSDISHYCRRCDDYHWTEPDDWDYGIQGGYGLSQNYGECPSKCKRHSRHVRNVLASCMPRLEKLRISAIDVGDALMKSVAGQQSDFPLLQEFQWDTARERSLDRSYSWNFLNTIDILQGRIASRPHRIGENTLSTPYKPEGLAFIQPRYIELRLGRELREKVLEQASTSEMRSAWTKGLAVGDAPHRVCIAESRAAYTSTWSYFTQEDIKAHHREDEAWWKARALEYSRITKQDHGQPGDEVVI